MCIGYSSPRRTSRFRERVACAVVAVMLITAVATPPLRAQSDKQAVIGVVNRLFAGMKARDTAMMWATVEPTAMLVIPSGPPGFEKPMPIGTFISGAGKGTGPGGTERITNPTVQVDGPLASLWAYYTYTAGGETKIDHCGVDVVLLQKNPGGWKIFSLAGTIRTTGCTPIP